MHKIKNYANDWGPILSTITSSKLQVRHPPPCPFSNHSISNGSVIASIIKHILAFQVLSRSYQFDPHAEVLYHLDKMQLLDGTEINKQSDLCEPDTT